MKILLFGIAKDIVGKSVLEVDNTSKTVEALKIQLNEMYPAFLDLRSIAIAVNNEYAADNCSIAETDEIAVIPPVSGG